jgi:tRNA G18 (ribose-2'-O)-methylase SpoU
MKTVNIKEFREAALSSSNNGLNVHDKFKGLTIEELKLISEEDRLPWHTICLNITGDLNIGTMVRTSHCLGATSVIVFGRQKIDNRSLVGAANYIKFEKILACNEKLELDPTILKDTLIERNLTPIFVEGGGTPLNQIDWHSSFININRMGNEICLIMGNETDGIPNNILKLVDDFPNSGIVSIPQKGVIRSFNVAVAHAIVAGDMCSYMHWMDN